MCILMSSRSWQQMSGSESVKFWVDSIGYHRFTNSWGILNISVITTILERLRYRFDIPSLELSYGTFLLQHSHVAFSYRLGSVAFHENELFQDEKARRRQPI